MTGTESDIEQITHGDEHSRDSIAYTKGTLYSISDSNNLPVNSELKEDESSKGPPPPDRFYIIYFLFLFMGLTVMMTTQYIFSANDFWMWKFRNTSQPWNGASDAENRTYLQATTFSYAAFATAIPSLVSLALIVLIVQRTTTRARITSCYVVYITIYFLYLIIAAVDTDSWQVGIAVVTLLLAAVNSGAFMILVASSITLIPNFPPNYVKIFTIGEGSAGIVTSVIQISCLAIGGSSQIAGLIYFGTATVIYSVVLALFGNSRRSAFFRYHLVERKIENDQKVATQMIKPTIADFKLAISEVWPVIVVYGCCIVGQHLTSVASLVVSENRGDGTAWTEKFFVPVVTMLLANIFGIIGRVCGSNVITPKTRYYMVAVNIVIAIVYLPLFIGCNAFPRKIPVFFPHDWQYIIILTTSSMVNGFFTTSAILSMPNFTSGRVQREIYYLLLQITLSIIGIGSAPLNIIVVRYIL